MKHILITLSLLLFLATTEAQTLKITDVYSANNKMYKEASESLGKSLIITIYDKSVKVQLPDGNKPVVLRLVTDNEYREVVDETDHETWTDKLTVNKTLGVVTSAVLTITVIEKGGKYRSASCVFTAKRF